MQEVYAALLLHENKQAITEENLAKVLQSAGTAPDPAKLKALVASLEETNIDELITQAAAVPSAPVEVKEKEEEKEEKGPEEAAAGLSSLFG